MWRQPSSLVKFEIIEGAIIAFCEKWLQRFARIVPSFPFTASGKIEKRKIRSETKVIIGDVWDRESKYL